MSGIDSSQARPAGEILTIDAARYLGVPPPRRVKPQWQIVTPARAVRPHPENRLADWLPTIVVPALQLIAAERGPLQAFASIGSGIGVDVLAGVEILGATVVGATDVFADVTAATEWNIRHNLAPERVVEAHVGHGDLLTPLQGKGLSFDVIYENLPNIPLSDASALAEKHNSANFVPPRQEKPPQFVNDQLLTLHYLALCQARAFLKTDGFVISTLGGRIPLKVMARLVSEAGLIPSVLTFSWKIQTEGEEVLPSYAKLENQGLGPFYYYPVDALERVFRGIAPQDSGSCSFEIEAALLPHRITATEAWQSYQAGRRIGHTVVALKSARQ